MRVLLTLLASLLTSDAVGHRDRIAPPTTITVNFAANTAVSFQVNGGKISGVVLVVGAVNYSVPDEVCAKLLDVRFESARFLWNGSFSNAAEADYLYLQFDMGSEKKRSFGELPQVQLLFQQGQFWKAIVARPVGAERWQNAPL